MLSRVVVVNRNTELARAREVIDFLSELPFREAEKVEMGERVERGSSCPLLVKGKSFELLKQEVKAWQIVVETTENKKKLALDLAINLPHNHPLKIKERVLDDVEHGVKKLNAVNGVKDLLTFMEEKVF